MHEFQVRETQFIPAAVVKRIRVEMFFIVPSRSEPSPGSKRNRLATDKSDDGGKTYKENLPSAGDET